MKPNKQFAKNLQSLSDTQHRLAKQYREWAAEDGPRSYEYALIANRLFNESMKYAELAEREMNHD